ncbi:glycosyltransferase [Streptomyces rapamycinicus NRRL 5491]|nr:glycosyltransferase [Streptomyces rapamycinicus]MBB4788820.1 hopene-associated glycosyltransferase HpnB [Streptomyces rapamycinicus]UTO67676.1 glycosyltransferase [Streptomyces rapamycinicus]UTP35627.1 glycosyltransferase [Streptomyces rapamycinicus NRRL 5491]
MSALMWIAAGSLAAWLWLLLGQGFFWRTDVRLPRSGPGGSGPPEPDGSGPPEPALWPSVAVVVPARDESAVLPASLPSLLAQDYPGPAEIFLIDDGSSDGTGKLARELADEHGGLPLTVDSPGEPGPGWTGKLWAVRHGMALATTRLAADRGNADGADRKDADGRDADRKGDDGGVDYLLLTDADIAHEPDSLRELVRAAEVDGLDLVSQMARLRVVTYWERLIVPAFVYFFAQLYPFRWVNRPRGRTAAAAGGCVLLRREAAERAGVPEAIRQAVIDDVALARAVKRSGGRIWLGLADRVDSVRPYPRLGELWRMVSRSAYTQLRHNPLLLLVTVAGLAVVYLVPPAAVVAGVLTGRSVPLVLGAAAWALMAGSYIPMLRYYRQTLWLAPLLPLTALLYLLMTVDSAVRHHLGQGAAWKGRTYARPSAAP